MRAESIFEEWREDIDVWQEREMWLSLEEEREVRRSLRYESARDAWRRELRERGVSEEDAREIERILDAHVREMFMEALFPRGAGKLVWVAIGVLFLVSLVLGAKGF